MKLSRIFSLASTALTIKAIWWDKLSQEDKDKYAAKAKEFFAHNKQVVAEKGKQFSEDLKHKKEEAQKSGSETPLKDAATEVVNEKKSAASETVETVKDKASSDSSKETSSESTSFDPDSGNSEASISTAPASFTDENK